MLLVAILVSAIGTLTVLTNPTGLLTTGSGTTNATVAQTAILAIPTNSINFGNIAVGATNDTTTNNPVPFHLRNDGNVNVNITLNSTQLWTRDAGTSADYKFMCGNESGGASCQEGSVLSFAEMPVANPAIKVIANLSSAGGSDTLEVEIKITAPVDEPAGAKSATVTFTASEA